MLFSFCDVVLTKGYPTVTSLGSNVILFDLMDIAYATFILLLFIVLHFLIQDSVLNTLSWLRTILSPFYYFLTIIVILAQTFILHVVIRFCIIRCALNWKYPTFGLLGIRSVLSFLYLHPILFLGLFHYTVG